LSALRLAAPFLHGFAHAVADQEVLFSCLTLRFLDVSGLGIGIPLLPVSRFPDSTSLGNFGKPILNAPDA
jgi:hypothetical protein